MGPSSLATAQNTSEGHLKGFTVDCPSELTVSKQIGVEGLGLLPSRCPDGVTVPGGGLRVDEKGLFAGQSPKPHIRVSCLSWF